MTFSHDQPLIEGDQVQDHGVFAVPNHHSPGAHVPGMGSIRGHNPEIWSLPVAADKEAAGSVVDVVFMAADAGQKWLEIAQGLIGAQQLDLGRVRAVMSQHDVLTGTAAPQGVVKGIVLLLVDQHVFGRVCAEPVPHHAVGEQGVGVLQQVEQVFAAFRPGQGWGGVLNYLRQKRTGPGIQDTDLMPPAADRILGDGHEEVVVADLQVAQPIKCATLGALIAVQQYFLGCVQ